MGDSRGLKGRHTEGQAPGYWVRRWVSPMSALGPIQNLPVVGKVSELWLWREVIHLQSFNKPEPVARVTDCESRWKAGKGAQHEQSNHRVLGYSLRLGRRLLITCQHHRLVGNPRYGSGDHHGLLLHGTTTLQRIGVLTMRNILHNRTLRVVFEVICGAILFAAVMGALIGLLLAL